MRIGINVLYLIPGVVGGTQTYAVSLLREMVPRCPDDHFVLYVNREARDLEIVVAPNVTVVHCRVRATRRAGRYAYEQLVMPLRARRDRLDVLHSLAYVEPLLARCPQVVTVHDLIYEGFKDHMGLQRRLALRVFVRASARRADRVITVSETSKRELVAGMGLDPDKVVVTREAGRAIEPTSATDDDDAILRRYGIGGRYVVAFGSKSPSKNIDGLVRAFSLIADRTDCSLVIIGHVVSHQELAPLVEKLGLADRVVMTGYVPDEHVVPLLRRAHLFAFPSLHEGFGLPLIDAQGLGVPVVSSDAASLPEVAGDGALLFDATSIDDMAAALLRGIDDEELRRRLVAAGHDNLKRYSWQSVAERTRQVYDEVAR